MYIGQVCDKSLITIVLRVYATKRIYNWSLARTWRDKEERERSALQIWDHLPGNLAVAKIFWIHIHVEYTISKTKARSMLRSFRPEDDRGRLYRAYLYRKLKASLA